MINDQFSYLNQQMPMWLALLFVAVFSLPAAAQSSDSRTRELEQLLATERAARIEAEQRVQTLERMIRSMGQDPRGEPPPQFADRWNKSAWQSTYHMLYPSAITTDQGKIFGRIMHISKDTLDVNTNGAGTQTERFHNLLGLDSNVRIGSGFGYGVTDNFQMFLQRSNGRLIFVDEAFTGRTFDHYDIMGKYQWLNELDDGMNLATVGGVTWMLEDNENGEVSVNLGVIAEKSLFRDRLYVGTGLLYASLSDFEGTTNNESSAATTKRHPKEPDTLGIGYAEGANHTLSVPATLRLALRDDISIYGEALTPVDGFDTGEGPTLVLGGRLVKKHFGRFVGEYNVFVTNSSNTSFNSSLTGGYKEGKLDIFGFNITINY